MDFLFKDTLRINTDARSKAQEKQINALNKLQMDEQFLDKLDPYSTLCKGDEAIKIGLHNQRSLQFNLIASFDNNQDRQLKSDLTL